MDTKEHDLLVKGHGHVNWIARLVLPVHRVTFKICVSSENMYVVWSKASVSRHPNQNSLPICINPYETNTAVFHIQSDANIQLSSCPVVNISLQISRQIESSIYLWGLRMQYRIPLACSVSDWDIKRNSHTILRQTYASRKDMYKREAPGVNTRIYRHGAQAWRSSNKCVLDP